MTDALNILTPILLALAPFVARYRGGIRLLIPTTAILGAAVVSNERWHWLTPRTFYGVSPWAWWATVGVITIVYLPLATRRSLRLLQFAGALFTALFVPALGSWIS